MKFEILFYKQKIKKDWAYGLRHGKDLIFFRLSLLVLVLSLERYFIITKLLEEGLEDFSDN